MNQRILITGAASGLGRALAQRYADDGWRVCATDVDEAALAAAVAALGHGDRVIAQRLDVRRVDHWAAARDRCLAAWDGLDVLVNNAGVASGGRFARTPLGDWDWIIDVNLKGVIRGSAAFVPLFSAQGHGHLVNVASLAGLLNPPLMASYNVVKAGVVSLSETLRYELEPQGVAVSVVCPSFFRTGLASSFRTPDPGVARLMERLVTASDVPPERIAGRIQRGVAAGRFLILTDRDGHVAYAAKRWLPPLFRAQVRRRGRRLLERVAADTTDGAGR